MAMVRKKRTSRTTAKKTPAGKKRKKRTASGTIGVLFWVIFFIIIFSLFFINRDKIRQTLADSQILEKFTGKENIDPQTPEINSDIPELVIDVPSPPAAENRTGVQPDTRGENSLTALPQQNRTEQETTMLSAREENPPQENAAYRERSIYFIKIDAEGDVYREKVNRRLPANNSFVVDVLNSLIAGPTREEQNRGLVSLIPNGSRILAGQTTVRDSTAYISISEDFQYNTHGVEGYAAALRQIIWTVTEFPNVDDVQILIEGRRIDYLGEGIWIGSPINRRF